MILPDVNMLLYAYDRSSKFHETAKRWLEDALSTEQVFFTWHTLTGFLRIATHPAILSRPVPLADAVNLVESWLDRENTHVIQLEKNNWSLFSAMLLDSQATGNLVMDAHIAAMARSCGATVASTDRDFTRFPGISLIDPVSKTNKR